MDFSSMSPAMESFSPTMARMAGVVSAIL